MRRPSPTAIQAFAAALFGIASCRAKIRALVRSLIFCGLLAIPAGQPVAAGGFPDKPITITNIYAPGGGTDLVARAIGRKLTEMWNVPVVIESKPGAGGTIAAAYVARQPADGYNLLITDVSYSITPSVYKHLSYDPLKDLVPVMLVNNVTLALTINPALPINTVAEFVDYAKKNPNKLLYASSGIGALTHLSAELLKTSAGINMVHVPYRGAVAALTDVMGGRVHMYIGALATPYPNIVAGRLKALAVMQEKRSPLLPNVPSIVEAGYPDLAFSAYYGILAPRGTPRPIVDKLAAAIGQALKTPEIKKTMYDLADEAVGAGPDEFAAFLPKDIARWRKAVEIAGIKPN
jgi:tripartite-type tricarboxylate transporter receptor subunit TctC